LKISDLNMNWIVKFIDAIFLAARNKYAEGN
jgi:hypothetical protein